MRIDNDRERVLANIAATLANELAYLQMLPAVQEHMRKDCSLARVLCREGFARRVPFKIGDLVSCRTSAGIKQNTFVIAFVESVGTPNDPNGLLLRAIGTNDLCNYSNEEFVEIIGIPKSLLWMGEQRRFQEKVQKVLRKLNTYVHRFRGLEFIGDDEADVYFGEVFGGAMANKATNPYAIRVKFDRKTTLKSIVKQLKDGGFGTRKFEPDDGQSEKFGNPKPITKADLLGMLEDHGIAPPSA